MALVAAGETVFGVPGMPSSVSETRAVASVASVASVAFGAAAGPRIAGRVAAGRVAAGRVVAGGIAIRVVGVARPGAGGTDPSLSRKERITDLGSALGDGKNVKSARVCDERSLLPNANTGLYSTVQYR